MKLITEYTETMFSALLRRKKTVQRLTSLKESSCKLNLRIEMDEYILKQLWNLLLRNTFDEQVSKNRAVGELNHPDGPTVNLDKVSHKIHRTQI
jgi:hypothetical protein